MAHHHFINSTFSDFHGPTAVDISKQQETQSSSISQHEEQQQQSRFSKKKTDLDVTKIPLLVRQIDFLDASVRASSLTSESKEARTICEKLTDKIKEVDSFRQTLRPGVLEQIVQKQIQRIHEIIKILQSTNPAKRNTPPVKKLEPKLAKKPMQVSLHNKNPVLKPLYKWEKRPSPSNEELEHQVSSFYEPITNTKSIYRPCIEPGHYIRSEITTQTLKSPSKGAKNQQEHTQTNGEPFEFRIILTEEEMKSLKFECRRLEAERKHYERLHGVQNK